MLGVSPFLAERSETLRRAERLREAEQWRLWCKAGLVRQSLLPKWGCWLLCQVGRLMVACGRRLEQYGRLQAVSPGR